MIDYQRVALLKIQKLHNFWRYKAPEKSREDRSVFFLVARGIGPGHGPAATGKDLFEARNDFPGKTNKPSKPK